MSTLYRVRAEKQPHFSDPLHWSNFFPDKQRHHRETMQKRQDLILYLAKLHAEACSSGMPLGMIQIPMRLMSLREWCQDYHVVLDRFFEVQQLGYNFGDGDHELSLITPKRLTTKRDSQVRKAAIALSYTPGERPDHGAISKVYIQQQNRDKILKFLATKSRIDLQAPVEWLLSQPEVNFIFERSGKLRLRDTSIWPVHAVETWPSELRELLFGPGLDIDSAYTQFLIKMLQKGSDRAELERFFPDLLRSIEDKKAWREELCTFTLGLEATPENIGLVKRLCMSLANGSKISPAILTGNMGFSVTADLVINSGTEVLPSNLMAIGKRLSKISKQYEAARKLICLRHLGRNPTRQNQKSVFSSYFEWERSARYAIWNACDQHGIMVHDGIDGIPEKYLKRLPQIMDELNIKLTHT